MAKGLKPGAPAPAPAPVTRDWSVFERSKRRDRRKHTRSTEERSKRAGGSWLCVRWLWRGWCGRGSGSRRSRRSSSSRRGSSTRRVGLGWRSSAHDQVYGVGVGDFYATMTTTMTSQVSARAIERLAWNSSRRTVLGDRLRILENTTGNDEALLIDRDTSDLLELLLELEHRLGGVEVDVILLAIAALDVHRDDGTSAGACAGSIVSSGSRHLTARWIGCLVIGLWGLGTGEVTRARARANTRNSDLEFGL